MKKTIIWCLLLLFFGLMAIEAQAQSKKKSTSKKKVAYNYKKKSKKEYFVKTKSGLRYIHHIKNTGTRAKLNDILVFNYVMQVRSQGRDTVIRNTYKEPSPFPIKVMEPTFKGGIEEGFLLLAKGDSISFLVKADSMFKGNFPNFIDKGSDVRFNMRVVKITTEEAYMAERQREVEALVAVQRQKEDMEINNYLKNNNITNFQKTASGLYYVITQEGNGDMPKQGQKVSTHYLGKLLNGNKFDSSYDRGEPLSFSYNQGEMIKGFDEGVGYVKKGGKATLFIPSHLGYGGRGAGTIPPFAVLIFEIELVNIE